MEHAEDTLLVPSVHSYREAPTGLCRKRRKSPRRGLDLLFLAYLWKLLRLMFPRLKSGTLLMFIFLLFVRGAEEFNVYNVGLVPSMFYKVIDSKDLDGFKNTLWTAALAVSAVAICKSVRLWVAGVLYVRWRVLITQAIHKLYFRDMFYYHLKIQDSSIDNPDQRITQDVERFCQELQNIVPQLVISPFVIAYYTYETYDSMGYYGPLSIYGFAILTAVANKFLIGPVVRAVFKQEASEGDFRFHHMQFRINTESAAFYRGGSIEARNANKRLQILYSAQHKVVDWTLPLNLSVNLFDYSGAILSYCLIGIPVFLGTYDSLDVASLSSLISKNAFVSLYLLNNFSNIFDLSTNISDLAGYTHRIGQLFVVLKKMDIDTFKKQTQSENEDALSSSSDDTFLHINMGGIIDVDRQVAFEVSHLSVGPPEWEYPLLKDISFNFEKEKNILVIGETGSGKSSLLKVISGLWEAKEGSFHLFEELGPNGLFVLPQKSYLTSGSLADQICFPHSPKNIEENDCLSPYEAPNPSGSIINVLQLTGMLHLRDRLGGVDIPPPSHQNWYDIVSPGEAQCLSFSRLFYHCPKFAVLDESTSAMSERNEEHVYATMKMLGITYLSIGHRSTLQKFHDIVIRIEEDGRWSINNID